MRPDFAEFKVGRFKKERFDIDRNSKNTNQGIYVTTEVAKVKKVVLTGGGPFHKNRREIVKLDGVIENHREDWNPEGIITAKEVETSRLRGKYVYCRRNFALPA